MVERILGHLGPIGGGSCVPLVEGSGGRIGGCFPLIMANIRGETFPLVVPPLPFSILYILEVFDPFETQVSHLVLSS